MHMIPYYVLTPEEYFTVRRIRHLMGYTLDGDERAEEVRAAGFLFRKNDPMRAEQYEAAYAALVALQGRLTEQARPDHWEGAAQFMAEERKVQAAMVAEALEALPHPSTLMPTPVTDTKYVGI